MDLLRPRRGRLDRKTTTRTGKPRQGQSSRLFGAARSSHAGPKFVKSVARAENYGRDECRAYVGRIRLQSRLDGTTTHGPGATILLMALVK